MFTLNDLLKILGKSNLDLAFSNDGTLRVNDRIATSGVEEFLMAHAPTRQVFEAMIRSQKRSHTKGIRKLLRKYAQHY